MTDSVHCTDLLFLLVAYLGAQDRHEDIYAYYKFNTQKWLELEIRSL